MSHVTLVRACVAALEVAGCEVYEGRAMTLVVLADGQSCQLETWRFRLLCRRVYEETQGGRALRERDGA